MENNAYVNRLRELVRQKPGSRLFLSLAEELKKLGRDNEAFELLIEGIRQHPDFLAAQLTLGRWYLGCNKHAEAAGHFSAALKKAPSNDFARKGLEDANRMLSAGSSGGYMSMAGPGQEPVVSKLSEADALIAQGHYMQAMELYDRMLTDSSCDNRILQRKEELASLIRFLRKDREKIVNRLNRFLEATKIHFGRKQAVGDGP